MAWITAPRYTRQIQWQEIFKKDPKKEKKRKGIKSASNVWIKLGNFKLELGRGGGKSFRSKEKSRGGGKAESQVFRKFYQPKAFMPKNLPNLA